MTLENARGFEFWVTDKDGKLQDCSDITLSLLQRKNGRVYETICNPVDAKRASHCIVCPGRFDDGRENGNPV